MRGEDMDKVAIAAHLTELTGDEWSPDDRGNDSTALVVRERDGLPLDAFSYANETRGHIGYNSEPGDYDLRRYDDNCPKIGVSLSREPKALAKEIVRRLLDDATDWHEEITGRRNSRDQYNEATRKSCERIEELDVFEVLHPSVRDDGSTRFYCSRGPVQFHRITVQGSKFGAEVSMDIDDAIKVLKFMKKEGMLG